MSIFIFLHVGSIDNPFQAFQNRPNAKLIPANSAMPAKLTAGGWPVLNGCKRLFIDTTYKKINNHLGGFIILMGRREKKNTFL